MVSSFEDRIKAFTAEILAGRDPTGLTGTSEADGDEQALFEAYREALREAGIGRLGQLVDSALKAVESKRVTSELVFEMFADAVDRSTVAECNQIVWGELESRAAELRKMTLSTQQRPKLALLRVANELLRRLSQTQDPILCGRVLMLLATALPLSDNSGFNSGGKYNVENETSIETSQQFVDEGSQQKDFNLYERFWKLQRFFAGPFVLSSFPDFKTCLETTLGAFDSKPLLAMDQQTADFFPKYLTSGRLLSLQLADPRLRRYVLVQILLFLRQISSDPVASSNADMTMQLNTWRTRCVRLLNQIPPKGKEFTEALVAAIDREVVWESWKKEKCPVIEQQGVPPESIARVPRSESFSVLLQSQQQQQQELQPPKWAIGKQQSQSWRDALTPDDEEDDGEDDDFFVPDRDEIFLMVHSQRMADVFQLPDYDFSAYDPRKDHLYCWQGMRAVRQAKLGLFEQLGPRGTYEDAVRLLNGLEAIDRTTEEERKSVTSGENNNKGGEVSGKWTPEVPPSSAVVGDVEMKDDGVVVNATEVQVDEGGDMIVFTTTTPIASDGGASSEGVLREESPVVESAESVQEGAESGEESSRKRQRLDEGDDEGSQVDGEAGEASSVPEDST